jgi:hypothetical protein
MPKIPADEQHRLFGFPPDRYETATGRNHPLQPIVHPEHGEAARQMDDQSDHRRADAAEARRHPAEAATMDVKPRRAQRRSENSAV